MGRRAWGDTPGGRCGLLVCTDTRLPLLFGLEEPCFASTLLWPARRWRGQPTACLQPFRLLWGCTCIAAHNAIGVKVGRRKWGDGPGLVTAPMAQWGLGLCFWSKLLSCSNEWKLILKSCMEAELLRKICGVGITLRLIFKSSEVSKSISIKGRRESSLYTAQEQTQSRRSTQGPQAERPLGGPTLWRLQPAQCLGHGSDSKPASFPVS